MRHMKYVICGAAMIAAFSPLATGQTPADEDATLAEPTKPATDGVKTFSAYYFEQYNPVTAFDMVSRVPGFSIDNGANRRGFGGTAGNILIDGERPSSKTGSSEQLKRVPAGSVERIELLSGTAANVDVRGQTQLVNVVLKDTAAGGTPTTFVAELRDIQYSERLGWTLQLTKTFALSDAADLTLDVQAPNLRGRGEGFEVSRNADGEITSYRETYGQPNEIGIQGSALLGWTPTTRDSLNFNIEYEPEWKTQGIGVLLYDPRMPDPVFRLAGRTEIENNHEVDIGGDWEHRFSDRLTGKLIGLYSLSTYDQTDVYNSFSPTGLTKVQTISQDVRSGERVGRGFLSWQVTDKHTLDFGLEGAFNYRDTTLDIIDDFGAGPVPVPIAVSDARVEEVRFEPFITDIWQLTEKLTMEAGFVFEISQITQTGDEEKEREFSYPKPRLVATYQLDPSNQFRASVERDVSQLNFSQFATAVNVVDDFSVRGNPNLEPEKTWKLRAEYDRRFGPAGAVTLALYHDMVEDVEEFVVIGRSDAYGNIGDGTRTGVEVQGTSRLDAIIPNSELRYSGEWRTTNVTDPITGVDRRFSEDREWNYDLSFRQELPSWQSAWGASVERISDEVFFKRLETIRNVRPGERVSLFAETTALWGVTIRADAKNIFHPEEFRTRTFYAGDPNDPSIPPRATGVILSTDQRKQKGGPFGTQVFSVRVSGTF